MLPSKPRFKLFAARLDRTAAMPFIMLTTLIDMISIGLIIPVLPALVGSFTVTATGFIAYSAVAGAVGAGGLGDLAIRYGYYRFETGVMVWCGVIMFVLVQATQMGGGWLARRIDKR